MRKIIVLICILPLISSDCYKTLEDCREFPVEFLNKSADTVIYAYKYSKNGQCYLDGWKVAPGGKYIPLPKLCQDSYTTVPGKVLEFYIVSPAPYINRQLVDCGLLNDHYPILKFYSFTKPELEKNSSIVYQP